MPGQTELALIIKTRDLGEADRLVTCLGPRNGRLLLLAKNARRSRRRFANCLEPLSLVKIWYTLKPHQELGHLERGELVTDFRELRRDLPSLAAAVALLEIAGELGGAVDHVGAIFQLLRQALQDLSSGPKPVSPFLSYLVRLLVLAGYGLDWHLCKHCHQPPQGPAWFNLERTGLLCQTCAPPGGKERLWPLHAGTRKLLAAAQRLPLEKLARLHYPPLAATEALTVLHRFITNLVGHELKSLEFLHRQLKSRGTKTC